MTDTAIGDTITVTDEMVEVGLDALYSYNIMEPSRADLAPAIREIFLNMWLEYNRPK